MPSDGLAGAAAGEVSAGVAVTGAGGSGLTCPSRGNWLTTKAAAPAAAAKTARMRARLRVRMAASGSPSVDRAAGAQDVPDGAGRERDARPRRVTA